MYGAIGLTVVYSKCMLDKIERERGKTMLTNYFITIEFTENLAGQTISHAQMKFFRQLEEMSKKELTDLIKQSIVKVKKTDYKYGDK
jgi:hypothetical protein